jgi:Flp pilus assembly protein TadG
VRATPLLKQSQRAGGRFASDQDGNIAPIFALSLLAVMGIVGMGVDYSQLSTRKATLDSLADSASLAGVTPNLLSQTDQASINAATTLFNSQTSTVKGIGPVTLNVGVRQCSPADVDRELPDHVEDELRRAHWRQLGDDQRIIAGDRPSAAQHRLLPAAR